MTKEKILDRIKKVLAYTNSPNEHEAAAAAAKVQALLAEHNLSMSDVNTEAGVEEKYTSDSDHRTDSYPWRRPLGMMVGKMYFCGYYYVPVNATVLRNGKYVKERYDSHCFIGTQSNIEVAKLMFAYLHETVDRLAKEGARSVPQSERHIIRNDMIEQSLIVCHDQECTVFVP